MKYFKYIKNSIVLRDGHLVLLSSFTDKIVNFILMVIAARFMPLAVYGNFSYVKSLVSVMIPFSGLGGNHALLRFGMDTTDLKQKYRILLAALLFGILFTLLLMMIVSIFFAYQLQANDVKEIFHIYIFFVLSYYIFDVIRNYHRINLDNRTYALISIRYALLSLTLSSLGLILFNYIVFLIILVVMPIFSVLIDNRKLFSRRVDKVVFEKSFWKYGVLVGIGAFMNQFFMQSDILVLGFLHIAPELIAQYKVASLLVYTLIFIPSAFLLRDFTLISAHAGDKDFLIHYVVTYLKYGSIALFIFLPLFYFLSPLLIPFIFGEKFHNTVQIQNILIFGLIAIVLLRMLFGNILNAVGKANLNVINAAVTIVLALPILIYLTEIYGVIGTAYGMTIIFFLSGLFSLSMFIMYVKKLPVK